MTPSRPPPKTLEQRLADLEFLFTHLERQQADLSRTLLAQQAQIDAIEKALRAMERAQRDAAEPPPEDLEE